MVAAHLQSQQAIATLIQVVIPVQGVLRFQNWQSQPYFYENEPYTYIDFDGGAFGSRSLGLGSSGQSVKIQNKDATIDSLQPVRDWLNQYDGWRRGEITIVRLWPDDLSAPPMRERYQIAKSNIKGGDIALTLKNPASALNALVPSFHLTSEITPELLTAPPGQAG